MLKRFSFFACALALSLSIGCSGGKTDEPTPNKTGESTSTKKFRVGVSLPAADHGWTGGAYYWAEEATKKYPEIEWNIQTAENSDDQIKDLDNMATKGMDALVILATESAPVTPKAKELHDKGIFIVNVDRGFTEDIADVFLAGDNKAFGRMSAEYIVEKLKGKGKILILRGIPCTVDTDRYDSAMEVFKKNPGIEVLDAQPGEWNKDKSYKAAQNMLTKNPKVDAIWSSDDDMSEGVEQALKEANRTAGVWMLGGGGKKEIVKRIMDGDPLYPATVTYPPSMTGQAVDKCVEILKSGKKPEKHISELIKLDIVTPANAKDFYFEKSVY
ncbi:MAG: ABC transporter substrate-binding protein [Fimbriimonadaceae bacterium]